MAMPKGFISNNGYATTSELGGKSYHEIAEAMTTNGYKMNHSTSRNVFVKGMKKLAKRVAEVQGLKLSDEELTRVAKDPRFQSGISEIINDSGTSCGGKINI
ncbi:MAG TPA: hypothetical protein DF712_17685 [Balneola sp.]|nr:hypothetical protein [Balneola sp.]